MLLKTNKHGYNVTNIITTVQAQSSENNIFPAVTAVIMQIIVRSIVYRATHCKVRFQPSSKCPSICPSVCLSHSGNVSKLTNVSLSCGSHIVVSFFRFLKIAKLPKFQRDNPKQGRQIKLTYISRECHYSTLSISETVQERNIITMEY